MAFAERPVKHPQQGFLPLGEWFAVRGWGRGLMLENGHWVGHATADL